MRYAIVIEKAAKNFAAYVPDLPGCVATGHTQEDAKACIREAIAFHIEGLLADGLAIPKPVTVGDYVDVTVSQPGQDRR